MSLLRELFPFGAQQVCFFQNFKLILEHEHEILTTKLSELAANTFLELLLQNN